MSADDSSCLDSHSSGQSKTFLWSIPRSASTTFLKSISQVKEGGVFWHEPLTQVIACGATKSSRRLVSKGKKGGSRSTSKSSKSIGKESSDGGFVFDAKKASLAWVKSELESYANQSETNFVFVKEMIDGMIDPDGVEDHLDWIPEGYQHSFLIRHPYRVCASFLNAYKETKSKYKSDLKQQIPNRLQCYSRMCTVLDYVKEHHDEKPVILDTDDLLANPVGMMQAYCKDISVPFTPSLLHWDAGDDIMKTRWHVAKQVIKKQETLSLKISASTFTSTGFDKPSDLPCRSHLPEELLPLIDRQMPFYEQLYEQSIKCYLFVPLRQRGSLGCPSGESLAAKVENNNVGEVA